MTNTTNNKNQNTNTSDSKNKSNESSHGKQGFASMSKEKVREIASQGGKASHKNS